MAKIELEGMQELIDKVNKLSAKGDDIKKKALNRAGEVVKRTMQSKAPRSNSSEKHMADHIDVSEKERSNGVDFVKIGPEKGDSSEFFYSKFTEWGTSKIPAQHWATKSVKENQNKINEIIKEELERGLNEID